MERASWSVRQTWTAACLALPAGWLQAISSLSEPQFIPFSLLLLRELLKTLRSGRSEEGTAIITTTEFPTSLYPGDRNKGKMSGLYFNLQTIKPCECLAHLNLWSKTHAYIPQFQHMEGKNKSRNDGTSGKRDNISVHFIQGEMRMSNPLQISARSTHLFFLWLQGPLVWKVKALDEQNSLLTKWDECVLVSRLTWAFFATHLCRAHPTGATLITLRCWGTNMVRPSMECSEPVSSKKKAVGKTHTWGPRERTWAYEKLKIARLPQGRKEGVTVWRETGANKDKGRAPLHGGRGKRRR